MLKRCVKCTQLKPLGQFHVQRSSSDGRRPACRECTRIESSEYYIMNRDKILARNREYRSNNKELRNASERAWREANRELYRARCRESYARNREKIRERLRRYFQARNPRQLISLAKQAIHAATGIPYRNIPFSMAEAKAAQLAVMREIKAS